MTKPRREPGLFLWRRDAGQRQVVTRRTIQPSPSTQSFFRAVKQLPSSSLPIAAVVAASSPSAGLPPPLCIAVKVAFGDFSAFCGVAWLAEPPATRKTVARERVAVASAAPVRE